MYQTVILLSGLIIVGYLAFYFFRSAGYASDSRHVSLGEHHHKRKTHHTEQPWHAVSCEGDCEALKPYTGGKRSLVANAPPLPVPSCTAERCNCKYVHHDDRRDTERGDRRDIRNLKGELEHVTHSGDRRLSQGRRRSDINWGAASI